MNIPSAIGTALISKSLPLMVAKAMYIGKRIGKYKAIGKCKAIGKYKAIDIAKLQSTLGMIEGVVQVAKQNQIDNVFIQNWLRDLVDIGYEAHDVLERVITFSYCIVSAKEDLKMVNFIFFLMLSYFGGSSSDTSNIPLAILNRLAEDITSVRERFDEKIKESETFTKLKSLVEGGSESVRVVERRPKVGPYINKQRYGLFLGREHEKEDIMQKILHPSDELVHVDVIWGMGGIGKTTLAQSIYNDERVKTVLKRWSCVGESKFSAEKVIKEIVNEDKLFRSWSCVGESKFCAEKVIKEIVDEQNTTGIVNLQTKLVKNLSGNRFLIVLDDVWDVDGSEWDLLFNPLTNVGEGGLIIITRREREVCAAITIQKAYYLKPLTKELRRNFD